MLLKDVIDQNSTFERKKRRKEQIKLYKLLQTTQ